MGKYMQDVATKCNSVNIDFVTQGLPQKAGYSMTPTNMKCPVCGATELTQDTRDLSYAYKVETTVISAVRGDFCRVCSESILDSVESDRVMQHMRTFSKQIDTARSRAWTRGGICLMTDRSIRDDADSQMVRQTVSVLVDADPQRG
ncbi:MAG: type II toxin-antitoxin system MqsA family antitoxin, partial [Hyphomicrobium sp.]